MNLELELMARALERSERENFALDELLHHWIKRQPQFERERAIPHLGGLVGKMDNVERLIDAIEPGAACVIKRGFGPMTIASVGCPDGRDAPFIALGCVMANVLLAAALRYHDHRMQRAPAVAPSIAVQVRA